MPNLTKYRAVRTNGYASRREANRAAELHLLEKAGIITDLQEQVVFELLPAAKDLGYPMALRYIADFRYKVVGSGDQITEDVKGMRTDVYIIKKRLMRQILGLEITEV